jgi:excisionase family DNA binding protein
MSAPDPSRATSTGAAAVILTLDDGTLERLADLVAQRIAPLADTATADHWMTTRQAAEYLGLTVAALHRHTASRTIPCAQDAPRARCWFKRRDLDEWREHGRRG